MEEELRTLMTGNVTIAGLVSDRITWNYFPQAQARPGIVMHNIAGAEGLTHEGPDGLSGFTVQIDVQALTAISMMEVRDAVLALLHGYKGGSFQLIQHVSRRETIEELTGGDLIHRCSMDFTIWAAA